MPRFASRMSNQPQTRRKAVPRNKPSRQLVRHKQLIDKSCPTTCLVTGGTAVPAPSTAPEPSTPGPVRLRRPPLQVDRPLQHHARRADGTINSSIVLIALPDIFRGIGINPLQPGNTTILLWMMMGFMVVTAVLVVSFGRLGDMFGRVRMFNMGFAIFAAVLGPAVGQLAARRGRRLVPDHHADLPGHRRRDAVRQLEPRSSPTRSRRTSAAWRSASTRSPPSPGSFIGLVLGGVLGPVSWRLVFLVSVPFGIMRHRLVLPQAQGARRAQARQARPRRQPDLRGRPDRGPRRHHLRHPALRQHTSWAGPARW